MYMAVAIKLAVYGEQKETESGLPLVFFGDFDDVFACFVSARIC